MCHAVYDDDGNLVAMVLMSRRTGPYDLEKHQESVDALPGLVAALQEVIDSEPIAPVVPISPRPSRRPRRRRHPNWPTGR